MIKGRCHTNLDGYGTAKWLEKFAAVPRLGELVQAKSGVMLRVVDVTHTMITVRNHDAICNYDEPQLSSEPCIRVELNR